MVSLEKRLKIRRNLNGSIQNLVYRGNINPKSNALKNLNLKSDTFHIFNMNSDVFFETNSDFIKTLLSKSD